MTARRSERVALVEAQPTIGKFVRALAQGDYPDARVAAAACRAALRRTHRRRTVAALGTLTAHILREARPMKLAYAKARWSSDDERIVRRYARGFVSGQFASARKAAARCQQEAETRGRRGAHRRSFYCYYWKLLALARSMDLPYIHRVWRPAERRVLERYMRRLLAGKFRYTRDAAAACTQELAELDSRATDRTAGSRRRPPRRNKAVYAELARMVAQIGLPRYKGAWTKSELEILERYARATERGEYRRWTDAADAAMSELHKLYARGGDHRVTRLAGRRKSDVAQQMWVLARRLHLSGPHTQRWTPPEERILRKWVKLYHEGHQPGRRGPIRAVSEGLRDELRNAGFTRLPSACRCRLTEGRRKLYRVAYPSPRRWTAEEDKVSDSWARWYDRHRRIHRLEPYKTATEGLQEDLAKIDSERSLCACRLRLLKRHRRLHRLA